GERRIVLHDLRSGAWRAESIVDGPESATGLQLALVGERWALLAAAGGGSRLWVAGGEAPVLLPELGGEALLQSSAAESDSVAIASSEGLSLVRFEDGSTTRIPASGTPARPTAV